MVTRKATMEASAAIPGAAGTAPECVLHSIRSHCRVAQGDDRMPIDLRRPRGPAWRAAVIAAVAIAGLAAGFPHEASAASPTLERIKTRGTIELAYRQDSAPFSFRDRDGRVRGYSVELCERAAESIRKTLAAPALKVNWRPVDAATRLNAVASGEVDIECGTTTVTLARMERVDFSVPIFVDGGSVLVNADGKLKELSDFANRRISVIAGTTTEQALTAQLAELGVKAVLVPVKSGAEGLELLVAGKVDGHAGDRIVLTLLRQRARKPEALGFLGSDFSYEPYALVVRRGDPDFRLLVNRALVATYKNGEIDGIFQRWFSSLGQAGPLLHAMIYLNRLPE
jgi:ABC-type amino acid transport substrate-binding protein